MALKIFNNLSKQKETFTSITKGHVGLYVCGPTVSGESHLGHARPYITFDVVNRYLQHLGYKVRYVRNITDAGHFEEEGREAEDKISKKAILEKLEPMELVQKYTNLFHWAMQQFNNLEPTIEPTATGHIIEQIEMIEKIIADGFGYEKNGSVYFDVEKYHTHFSKQGMPYGMLSGRILEDMLETTRELDNQEEKNNKADFALWKNAAPEHIMRWKSPWGYGFPGWHIECSAMSSKYLGQQFDIHGGGMDLQFPHHECEIAQSTVCHGITPAKFWMHNNMITINGRKMGKSYNNVIKLTELFSGNHPLLSQPFHPMVIRFFILQTHYSSTLDFSNEALLAAEKGLKRLWEGYENLLNLSNTTVNEIANDAALNTKCIDLINDFETAINDDFGTAKILANMFEMLPTINAIKNKQLAQNAIASSTIELMKKSFTTYLETIMGLQTINQQSNNNLDGVMQLLMKVRLDAKAKKDFVTSDTIRKELLLIGIQLNDEKDGTMNWSLV
jgi:cysteinyl-tRNA synthetase